MLQNGIAGGSVCTWPCVIILMIIVAIVIIAIATALAVALGAKAGRVVIPPGLDL